MMCPRCGFHSLYLSFLVSTELLRSVNWCLWGSFQPLLFQFFYTIILLSFYSGIPITLFQTTWIICKALLIFLQSFFFPPFSRLGKLNLQVNYLFSVTFNLILTLLWFFFSLQLMYFVLEIPCHSCHLFVCFGCTHDMQKFHGQRSKLHHSSNLLSSDNARSLTARPPANSLHVIILLIISISPLKFHSVSIHDVLIFLS